MSGVFYSQNGLEEDGLKAPLSLVFVAFVPAGNLAVALGGGCLYKAQLPDIAGIGGLRYLKAFVPQVLQQHRLSADGMLLHKT